MCVMWCVECERVRAWLRADAAAMMHLSVQLVRAVCLNPCTHTFTFTSRC